MLYLDVVFPSFIAYQGAFELQLVSSAMYTTSNEAPGKKYDFFLVKVQRHKTSSACRKIPCKCRRLLSFLIYLHVCFFLQKNKIVVLKPWERREKIIILLKYHFQLSYITFNTPVS